MWCNCSSSSVKKRAIFIYRDLFLPKKIKFYVFNKYYYICVIGFLLRIEHEEKDEKNLVKRQGFWFVEIQYITKKRRFLK